MYQAPKHTQPAQPSRSAQIVVTGVVVLIIVGWFFRDLNLITNIKGMMWEIKKMTMSEVDLYMEEGVANLEGAAYRDAVDNFSKVIEIEPENAEAYAGRARAYCMMQDAVNCSHDMDLAIALMPNNAQLYYERTDMLYPVLTREEVYFDLNTALTLKPDYFDALLIRAILYSEDERWDESIVDYQGVIKTMPVEGVEQDLIYNIYMGQALAFFANDMPEEAVSNYHTLYKLAPDYVYLLQLQAPDLQLRLQQMEPGTEAYKQLEELIERIQSS